MCKVSLTALKLQKLTGTPNCINSFPSNVRVCVCFLIIVGVWKVLASHSMPSPPTEVLIPAEKMDFCFSALLHSFPHLSFYLPIVVSIQFNLLSSASLCFSLSLFALSPHPSNLVTLCLTFSLSFLFFSPPTSSLYLMSQSMLLSPGGECHL